MSNDLLISDARQPTSGVEKDSHWKNQLLVKEQRNTKVSEPMNDPEISLAIEQLKSKLSSEQSRRHGAPRGYYLNIRV